MNFFGLNITVNRSKKRAYEAADKGRRAKTFRLARSTGANREVAAALVTLRNRSRHMVRNNGWAKRAVEVIARHTVGEGIQPAPIVVELLQRKKIKEIWRQWATTTDCDWYGKTNFYGLQELAMRTITEGGEVLIIKRWVENNESGIPLKLELMEGDRLDHNRNGINEKGIVRMGVQFTQTGELTGYWLFDYHPGDDIYAFNTIESRFFEKADVIHSFELLRIGQVRGLPIGVASFMKIGDFSDYEDAQLLKQKVAACFAAFIVDGDSGITPTKGEDDSLEILEPGVIEHLKPGDTVEFANPPSVSDYDGYSTKILQGVAASYGITYEMLTMDYSRVNFTSGRMAKIDVTANFKSWQYNMLVPQICNPVWKWFIDACLIVGKITAPVSADWTAPRVQQLDPVKETGAQIKRIRAGLATLSETIRETGREPEEFFEEYTQDVERVRKLGITIESIITSIASGDGTI
ncbi:MAG: phage portal protein [Dysgonamonadaceae bacterium]|jgi:lambda family phage portal protein|nr:phage portal protein [Dysgonamonadaceae bacterium]